MRKFLSFTSLFLLVLGLTLGIHFYGSHATNSTVVEAAPRTAFVHLFEWTWDDIAQECETSLGPQGFKAVQISPPNEHVVLQEAQFPWWQRYQPVSYRLVSRSGDRAQLASMIRRCHAAGVKVYADAVINHMTGVERGVGSAGSTFTKYNYPGIYQSQDFNDCRHAIQTYQDRYQVTSCELVGLSDLRTSSPYVRHRIAAYLRDLLSLDIDGFRIDAAKHIPTTDLKAILKILDQSSDAHPFVYQEVIDPGTEAIKKAEYYSNGAVIEFEYGRRVGEKFSGVGGQHLAQLEMLGESWGLAPSDKAIIFIDNHDKQRGHGGGGNYLTYKNDRLYALANVFMLAHPYGYPQVMSSYAFSDSDQGPPADATGKTLPVFGDGSANCGGEWVCEHRWGAIARMVGFRNATAGVSQLTNWWSNGRNQIAFGRGDRGFVAINREAMPLTQTFQTQLSPGTYCNIVKSGVSADGQSCSIADAAVVVQANGQVTATIPEMGAIALHAGAKL